ncbi:tail fiber domain-containing protein [Aureibacter tunicatorum]|uniref:ACT domain-containing protein n=1 Tax=Aureibacter tunicatorum TaxID=866807 RepID=A0AAE3XTU2_9BACT|nr:tail fiber domain-containing protein [Aureibacter tunicatorum]MDR6241958.1 ACT domain-containing protein [Aureibacter tunicatorum]BDD07511.1 hypothetical protein AUTU_49940 [Aureibacter tunicatorum]
MKHLDLNIVVGQAGYPFSIEDVKWLSKSGTENSVVMAKALSNLQKLGANSPIASTEHNSIIIDDNYAIIEDNIYKISNPVFVKDVFANNNLISDGVFWHINPSSPSPEANIDKHLTINGVKSEDPILPYSERVATLITPSTHANLWGDGNPASNEQLKKFELLNLSDIIYGDIRKDMHVNSLLTVNKKLTVNDIIETQDVLISSDARFKENILPITEALEKIKKLNGVSYTRNDTEAKDKKHVGFIAQEVEGVLPELVEENADGYKSVKYAQLTAVLSEAIIELDKKIDKLNTAMDNYRYLQNINK